MNELRLRSRQRSLFQNEMNWEQLPTEVREQVVALLAALCVELVDEAQPPATREQCHGSTED